MNSDLQSILDLLKDEPSVTQKTAEAIEQAIKSADKKLTITEFKLQRMEKVKRTTSILLEETIEELELKRKTVEESKEELQESLAELKETQEQLVQQEKLASLGQLAAGIAHEIKNPLNFVNNFSELSLELIEEIQEDLKDSESSRQSSLILNNLKDIEINLIKIHEHGSRADSIVKSMLQHSRGGDNTLELTDLNPFLKEYVNLTFHGMRASKNPMNVDIDLQLDENIKEVPLMLENFSRVILNLCNNAFDAMRSKLRSKADDEKYRPKLTVRSRLSPPYVLIDIEDNGPGIPAELKDKILQPFFTTKKGKEGTGLGLSITNDIIKLHRGSLQIKSECGSTVFTIQIPLSIND